MACAANCDSVCRQKVVTFAASALQARRVYILCKCYKTAGFRCPLHVLGTGFLWWSTVGAFLSQLEGVHACAAAARSDVPRAHSGTSVARVTRMPKVVFARVLKRAQQIIRED